MSLVAAKTAFPWASPKRILEETLIRPLASTVTWFLGIGLKYYRYTQPGGFGQFLDGIGKLAQPTKGLISARQRSCPAPERIGLSFSAFLNTKRVIFFRPLINCTA